LSRLHSAAFADSARDSRCVARVAAASEQAT
jgi:hypothetical protein